MGAKVAPPSVLRSHWTVGVGWPEAEAVKVTGLPVVIVWERGFVVTVGVVLTVNVAAAEMIEPAALVKTARNWLLFCAAVVAGMLSVVLMAPARLLNVAPPSVLNCH